jgi:cytochrome c553
MMILLLWFGHECSLFYTESRSLECGRMKNRLQRLGETCSRTEHFSGQKHIARIAGLQYEYLVKQLRGFKSGERPDIDGTMTSAAQPLSDKDITDVSWFLAGLR